jgi:citrate lyase subunit beta/citryl-CoA lyase
MNNDSQCAAIIAAARTFLFVPGDRPERVAKAYASGADVVTVDLEDAVAPDRKDAARSAIARVLDATRPVMVRINAADSRWHEADLALCAHPGVLGIMLPKAEPGPFFEAVVARRPVLALLESAAGVMGLSTLVATPGLVRLAIGEIDLSLDLDIIATDDILAPLRLQMVIAARAARLAPPVAGVTTDFRDPAVVAADAARARAAGFGGKLCIHPAQVAPVLDAFRPDAAQSDWARRIVDADARSGGAAVAVDGQMVDRPVVERARRILAGLAEGNSQHGIK